MMEMKDSFLADIHLTQLDELIDRDGEFAWYLQKEQVRGADDGCYFSHMVYDFNQPKSKLYDPLIEIFKYYLKYVSWLNITVNLQLRQETPKISVFHTDFSSDTDTVVTDEKKITTAIFYLNTNNGYTEFEGGDKIDCVRNRLIMFPANIPHRAIGQTDVIERIVLNFNFIL